MSEVRVRALVAADAEASRALVTTQFAGTPYFDWIMEQLNGVLAQSDPEREGLVAVSGTDARVIGLVLFGAVAGATGVARIHALVGDAPAALRALIAATLGDARMSVCELADDAPHRAAADALLARGFVEEGRVADFFRDGVALRLLTRMG